MKHQLWKAIVAVLMSLDQTPKPTRLDFSDVEIVKVYYWSFIWDRPTSWAGHGRAFDEVGPQRSRGRFGCRRQL